MDFRPNSSLSGIEGANRAVMGIILETQAMGRIGTTGPDSDKECIDAVKGHIASIQAMLVELTECLGSGADLPDVHISGTWTADGAWTSYSF